MATHDYNLANQDGASFRSDLNNALAAIVSNNSSSTAPASTFAHQIWVDTTANVIKQRNAANDAWVELWRIDGGFNAKTFSSNVTLNAQSDLRFADSDSSNWVAFQAPATVSSNVTWTLPSADGTADQALTTNGSGVLSWADAGGVQDNITEGNTSAEVVDTGSDGHFKVVTEGTEALRVDSSQRVGIGTTSPGSILNCSSTSDLAITVTKAGVASAKLGFDTNGAYVEGVGGGQHLGFRAGNSERVRIDSSGRLLTGDTESVGTARIKVAGDTNSANNGGTIALVQSRLPPNGSTHGVISFGGAAGRFGAQITSTAEGAWASDATSHPTDLRFWTTPSASTTLTERMRITSAGRFDLGGGSPGGTKVNIPYGGNDDGIRLKDDVATGTFINFYANSSTNVGSISHTSSSTSYNTSSDYRLKENVVDLNGAITRVKQLAPKRFNFIADETDTLVDGFLAHEAQAVVPEAVTGTQDGVEVWKEGDELPDGVSVGDNKLDEDGNTIPVYQGIDQAKLVPLLTAALQEAIGKIEILEAKVAALEAA